MEKIKKCGGEKMKKIDFYKLWDKVPFWAVLSLLIIGECACMFIIVLLLRFIK